MKRGMYMENESLEEMIKIAKEAKNRAYAKYSNYKVGAALKTKSGKIYSGCNIENNGIMSICAERVAFLKAISEGENEFEAVLVIGDNLKENVTPCGYCRQFINEFVDKDFIIYSYSNKEIKQYTISELLPEGFNL